jgi:radical SAM superfamily enzyme YgiQ (UPF0313 family)
VKLVVKNAPRVLLINPWIYDFAAHDLWSKPLGLLLLAGLLRTRGYQVSLLDCLNVHDPRMQEVAGIKPATRRTFGTGKFHRMEVEKPPALADMGRSYYRFGITPDIFRDLIEKEGRPDVVLVTSAMTYWYPGVQVSIRLIKEHFPQVPVVLGGIYATLCPDHATRYSGADHIITGPGETRILELLGGLTGYQPHKLAGAIDLSDLPWPAFDLLEPLDYVCVLTSRGCPSRCPYCASALLYEGFHRRRPDLIVDELEHWHEKYRVVDIAFYDDALLLDADDHIVPVLAEMSRRELRLRLHTPNGVHVNRLSEKLCEILFTSGFKTLRLGLETSDSGRQHQLGAKVEPGAFSRAMSNLTKAGFSADEIGVYLLCGLPGQNPSEVAESISIVKDHGARPYLAEYSPLPGTSLWPQALRYSPFPLGDEPLYHNNSLLPCQSSGFGLDDLQWLKQLCKS